MFCQTCGSPLSPTAKFCPNCGQPVSALPPPPPPDPALTSAFPQPEATLFPTAPPIRYAGFWLRFVAWLIDSILTGIVAIILFAIFAAIFGIAILASGGSDAGLEPLANILIYAISILVAWIYYALCESSALQATLGKKALGLTVTDVHLRRISFARASGRFFSKIVSTLFCYLGFVMAAFTGKKQALHDLFADTLVLRS